MRAKCYQIVEESLDSDTWCQDDKKPFRAWNAARARFTDD
ncbi:hypothetical protein M7I_2221 [Glarea lozoyensis 74030]|uniref:Uncharacterized protein n=1 Tax=Glarea lozoyensis (strain ATCC 74030 / MF5533) TaxID=1104152 RepID=H0EI71_GLAL7|nr:hypothetical protein M7I_2221 [Glarea lozoyensis 74030]